MTKSTKRTRSRIDVHKLLRERREIAIIWCIDDVQSIRPDLDDEAAWKVLLQCEHFHDCDVGFNWLLIETIADDLFPQPSDPPSKS